MFRKILVANRGEIAIRVMRACRELGIASVAVYSEADKEALFVKYADEAFCIGPPPARASYLNIEKIIEVAKKKGADAIHPGYGFLAENRKFARSCEEEGIRFIGPSSRVLELMGDKITARREMIRAGVPVVPGTEECVMEPGHARDLANAIGYPVIIKPSGGGGGIGMTIVANEGEWQMRSNPHRPLRQRPSVFATCTSKNIWPIRVTSSSRSWAIQKGMPFTLGNGSALSREDIRS
jgi:pyruvate carboxylase subunit A